MTAWAIVLAAAWWAECRAERSNHMKWQVRRAHWVKYFAAGMVVAYTVWDVLELIDHGLL